MLKRCLNIQIYQPEHIEKLTEALSLHFDNLIEHAQTDESIVELIAVIFNNPYKIRKEFFE